MITQFTTLKSRWTPFTPTSLTEMITSRITWPRVHNSCSTFQLYFTKINRNLLSVMLSCRLRTYVTWWMTMRRRLISMSKKLTHPCWNVSSSSTARATVNVRIALSVKFSLSWATVCLDKFWRSGRLLNFATRSKMTRAATCTEKLTLIAKSPWMLY